MQSCNCWGQIDIHINAYFTDNVKAILQAITGGLIYGQPCISKQYWYIIDTNVAKLLSIQL